MIRNFYRLYFIMLLSVAVSATVILPILQHLFIARFDLSADDDLIEGIYTFRDRLVDVPRSDWSAFIERTRAPLSLFPVVVRPRSAVPLNPVQREQLDDGLALSTGPGEVVVGIPRSDLLLQLHRRNYHFVTNAFNLLAWCIFSLILVMSIYVWLRIHWNDVSKLRVAADAFGEGRLDTRVHLSRGSELSTLGDCFDAMAARIQVLVSNQNDMINAVSHELRTPIARFEFSLALLRTAPSEAQRHRHIDALSADVRELDELVAELLSYGAIDRLERSPERHAVTLVELLDSVAGSLALEMEARDVRCTITADATVVMLDPRLTSRALLNLLKNAVKYCRHTITMEAFSDGATVTMRVDDDGIGIPAADRRSVLEPFHRLDRSRDRKTGGHGLGLAIAHRAVQSQGGIIRIGDSPLGGARLEIVMLAPSHGSIER